jgi:DNA-binding GntR family transcriptional regulator
MFSRRSNNIPIKEETPMQYQTKKDYAYEQIKDEILSGRIKSGAKLVISSLAKKYGMSHIPVREALSELFREGLVENEPYTSARVANLDLENIIELSIIRTEMECLALRVAQPFLTDTNVEDSRRLLKQLYALYAEKNLREYIVVNHAFYVSLFSYGPYRHMQDFIRESFVYGRISTTLVAPGHVPALLEGHEELLRAIEAREAETAVRLYRRQKNLSLNAVLDVMREVLLDPGKLARSTVTAFYTAQGIRDDKNRLLAQLDWLRKLIKSTEH